MKKADWNRKAKCKEFMEKFTAPSEDAPGVLREYTQDPLVMWRWIEVLIDSLIK